MKQHVEDNQEARQTVAEALRRPMYEVIPLQGAEEQVMEHVPKAVKVTVRASPKKAIESTLELAERRSTRGYATTPHLSARLVPDAAHLG